MGYLLATLSIARLPALTGVNRFRQAFGNALCYCGFLCWQLPHSLLLEMDADFTDSLRGMSKRRGIQKKTKKYANKLRHRVLTRGYTEVECFNLINAVKRHECVWNLSSEHYKNRTHCQMAWDEIEMEVGIPKEDITVKWTLLRQQFRVSKKYLLIFNYCKR